VQLWFKKNHSRSYLNHLVLCRKYENINIQKMQTMSKKWQDNRPHYVSVPSSSKRKIYAV